MHSDKRCMDKISIDTQIYVDKLFAELENIGFIESLQDSEELRNPDNFKIILKDEITLAASVNEIEFGDPLLSEDQFDVIVNKCVIKDALDDLVEQGLIEGNFDPNEMDTIYSLKEEEEDL